MKNYTPQVLEQIKDLLDVSIALSAEKDYNQTLEMILSEARKITNADAGTLYLREDEYLKFKISHNDTLGTYQGGAGEEVDLPKVKISEDTVSGYTAINKETINIADVYQTEEFDFSGPKKYDKLTGYQTQSMLVVPLEDHKNKVIGVLQLINAQDETGEIITFAPYLEKVIKALASQAAISLSNNKYLADINNLLYSFVKVTATMIDQRSPYNANHTYRIAKRTERLAELIDQAEQGAFAKTDFSKERKEQLVMAAWLHDIGKIAVPLSIMDKATRLEERVDLILQRLSYIKKDLELSYLKAEQKNAKKESKDEYEARLKKVEEARKMIIKANDPANFIDQDMIDQFNEIASLTYTDIDGKEKNWLRKDELTALSIQKGTLTAKEKEIMQQHVTFAKDILKFIPFPDRLKDVPNWIVLHHEYLDGSGYPKGLSGDEIALEGRILALVDIFDALTASDRPYKKAMSNEKALSILASMVEDNKLDADVFEIFKEGDVAGYLDEVEYNFLDLKEVRVD